MSRAQILDAALRIVDRDGLAALSMRRLGQALGVEAMSLYNHVPNKDAVLDSVHEAVLEQVELPAPSGDWRADARSMARAFRRALLAHPHSVELFASRPAITPGSLRIVEYALELVRPAFAHRADRVRAVQVIFAYVLGHVSYNLPAREIRQVDYAGLEPREFSNLREVATTLDSYDVEREFEWGLSALVRGLRSTR